MGLCRDRSLLTLRKYGYHAVRLPSAEVEPLQLIGAFQGRAAIIGSLADLVVGGGPLPEVKKDVAAAGISSLRTNKTPLSISASLLDDLVNALGGTGKASAGFSAASTIEVRFNNVKKDVARLVDIGTYLQDQTPDWDHMALKAFLFGEGRLYVVRETLKSAEFAVGGYDHKGGRVALDVSAARAAVASVEVSAEGELNDAVRYRGPTPLVFGFAAEALVVRENAATGVLELAFESVAAGQIALSGRSDAGNEPGTAFPQGGVARLDRQTVDRFLAG